MEREMKRRVCCLVLMILFAACAAHAQSDADKAAVAHVPQAFADAWAKHDGHQLALIMADDVDFVNVGGDWLHGRADFETYHSRLLSGRFKDSTLTVRQSEVRFLRPDLALLHWSWGLAADRSEDGSMRKPRMGIFTMMVEKRKGAWLVVAAQNTNWMPGSNPEMDGITPPIAFPQ
jgi:uncharacterized protein (TIGR02246 family)